MSLRTTVNSFDLFDTLVARRCVTPHAVFAEVEQALAAVGFRAIRVAAEQALMRSGRAFDIHDIYRHIVANGQCDAAGAKRLLAAEIDAEFDNAIPIVENLRQVQELDLVVSDMYLPADILRRLLQHVGLRVYVHLCVANAGKHHGHVWPALGQRWLINRHLGDNPQADVELPRRHGIPTLHYAGAGLSEAEQLLAQHGLTTLAQLMRALRLRNPCPPGSTEAALWNLYIQLNLPLLLLASRQVLAQAQAKGKRQILFSARDCYFLSEIFSTLYPGEPADYLYLSRQALWHDRPAVDAYLRARNAADSLICDIASTGYSWFHFAETTQSPLDFFTLVYVDTFTPRRLEPQTLADSRLLRFSCQLRTSELNGYSNAIEVLNTAPYASTQSIVAAGDFFAPTFDRPHELDRNAVATLVSAHAAAIELLRRHRPALLGELVAEPAPALLRTLVQSISAAPLLRQLGQAFR